MSAELPPDQRAIAPTGRAALEINPASTPDTLKPGTLPSAAAECGAPAILRVANAAEITDAVPVGGDFLLLADDALLDPARATGLGLLREICLHRAAPGDALLEEHPDWFVHGRRGPVFRHLSDTDATVDWWEAELARLLAAGYAGFYCRDAHLTAPAVWAQVVRRGAAHGGNDVHCRMLWGDARGNFGAARRGFRFRRLLLVLVGLFPILAE